MRILYVIDSMAKDGAETQLLKILGRLGREEFEVFVVLSRYAGERYHQLTSLPIVKDVILLDAKKPSSILSLLEKAVRLRGIIQALQPEVVHSWLWYSNLLCGVVHWSSCSRQMSLVVSQRGDYQARYGRLRLWITEKTMYNRADVILTNSDRIRRNLDECYPEKRILAIQNIINLPSSSAFNDLRNKAGENQQQIVSIGRLDPEKGHEYLIQALCLLHADFNLPNTTVRILGEGLFRHALCHLAALHHVSDYVKFSGFCHDIFPALASAEVFVLSSLHESSPNALIEAMGVGLPCIASDVGGIRDLIEDEQTGLLVPSANPEALASAIHRVLTDRDFAEHLGKGARSKIRHMFDNERSIQQLEAVYRECPHGGTSMNTS